jgi:phage terminase large subunit
MGGDPIGGYSVPVATNFEKPAELRRQRRKPRGLAPATGNPTKTPHAPVPHIESAPENLAQDAAGQTGEAPAAPVASVGSTAGSSPAVDPQAAWALIIEAYKGKPVEFAIDIIGVTPDPWQADAMNRVARGARRLTVRAGHGVGKSAFCAWLVIWFMVTRFPQKTVLTAPTQGQLFDALFAEVKSWTRKLPEPIRDLFDLQSEKIVYKAKPEDSFVSARTSSKERPEALAGVHSDNVLLIADEASAIPEEVFEAAAGSMSGFAACTILISNPTRNTGLFFQTHHNLAHSWERMHVSCLDSKRVDPDFVQQIIDTYGIDSNQYRVRVLGEFSVREDDVLIPAELVDSAMDRDIVLDTSAPIIYGVDIARFGDDRTVLLKRQGGVVVEVKWWSGLDTMQTVGRVVVEAKQDNPAEICVDSIGIGAGVADRLRELGFNCLDVNVAESAALNPQARRLRDDLWLQIKDWLNTRAVKLPKIDRLRQDLVAPTYSFDSAGMIVVEPKSMMKKRKLPSPDFADALGLTFAGSASLVGGRASSWIPGKPLRRNLSGVV